ncbi:peptide-methionine (S)-S-oxide reductase MsrA [Gloeobacter kilaueensis]|uniref:Peptide methionine sulfoxide reductase MsrA n=1 Tax=Gloeobacter kilaueensis (strain ATCC BAA-2537 / CCAP 1431/1 / ULC 316 / JS1) TaxID=1183438 RepID=U5QEN7_GLOK1|nr:peptide-methionine (S)-S-oxide reductase MsrA [Gloeobacter kilaueensis]AGY57417.1 peptide methionine sulfoxide reductase [Gloeobacter kilaueensis JS1]
MLIIFRPLARALSVLGLSAAVLACRAAAAPVITEPQSDIPATSLKGKQTAVFAGGCFWGVEAVFEHLKGVSDVVSGFAGGDAASARYETVSEGNSGHAESVKITYDPAQISYGQLLKIFFFVAHDPTQLNRQGPDTGTQYRSAIFFGDPQQKRVALAYIDQLTKARAFSAPIVTQVAPLGGFYPAEAYHQDFIAHHPNYPYVVINDLPKLALLREQFPKLYK